MLTAAKFQVNAAERPETLSVAPKTQKTRGSMTVPTEARKLKILCLHGYLQNAEVQTYLNTAKRENGTAESMLFGRKSQLTVIFSVFTAPTFS
jgi:hypothetical protein